MKLIMQLFPEYEQYQKTKKAVSLLEGSAQNIPTIWVMQDLVNFHRLALEMDMSTANTPVYIKEIEVTLETYKRYQERIESWEKTHPYARLYYNAEKDFRTYRGYLKADYPELYQELKAEKENVK